MRLAMEVEGAAPKVGGVAFEQHADARHHFGGGFVGEGEQENAVGGDALLDEEGGAIGQGAGLAGTGAGDDESGAGRSGDGGALLFVEIAVVIHPQPRRRAKGLQDVMAGHGASSNERRNGSGYLWVFN